MVSEIEEMEVKRVCADARQMPSRELRLLDRQSAFRVVLMRPRSPRKVYICFLV